MILFRTMLQIFDLPRWSGIVAMASWGLSSALTSGATKNDEDKSAGDELFSGEVVPRLEFQIPPESMEALRGYHQVWRQPRPERLDVKVRMQGRSTFAQEHHTPSISNWLFRTISRLRTSRIHLMNREGSDKGGEGEYLQLAYSSPSVLPAEVSLEAHQVST